VLLVCGKRHEVDQGDGAVFVLERRLENSGLLAVAPRDSVVLASRCDPPVAVLFGAEERGEAGVGIEAWQAQPVD
jgi:hypothetical protein